MSSVINAGLALVGTWLVLAGAAVVATGRAMRQAAARSPEVPDYVPAAWTETLGSAQ